MSYTIAQGDTLGGLATSNNTSVDALMKANPSITDPNKIYAGASLNLPTAQPAASPTVVSNYNTQSKVNDINSTFQNHANTSTPEFPTGTKKAVYAPSGDGTTGNFLGYATSSQDEQNLLNSQQNNTQSSFGNFSAPQGAVQQGDGTYMYQGNYYTKDQLSSPESLAAISNTTQTQKKYDTALQGELDAINKRFDMYRQQQEQITGSGAAGAQNALLQTGAGGRGSVAQYAAASSDARVKSIMSDGQKALQELDSQRSQLLSAAQMAYQDKNSQLLDRLNTQITKNRDDMLSVSRKANEKIAEEQKQLQQVKLQSDKDAFITDAFTSGTQDTATIIKNAKEKGINLTAKDVATALDNSGVGDIQKIASAASGNGATLAQIHEISNAKTPFEAQAIVAKYGLGQDKLDTAYKKAQIAKMYNDIAQSGADKASGIDPAQLVAYAQEYASTGKIPTGMPKGSFGVISQLGKEAPKQHGEIVSTATGVKPAGETAYTDALANLASATELAKQLKELDKQRIGGVVSGTLGKVFGSEDQTKYVDLRTQIIDLLSRARSGAALTPHEEETYGSMLPSRFSEPCGGGANSDVKIDNFINNLSSDLSNKASSKGWSVYGVTKVKLGGSEYTVGDIIKSPDGKSGRINPDGSITLVQ